MVIVLTLPKVLGGSGCDWPYLLGQNASVAYAYLLGQNASVAYAHLKCHRVRVTFKDSDAYKIVFVVAALLRTLDGQCDVYIMMTMQLFKFMVKSYKSDF